MTQVVADGLTVHYLSPAEIEAWPAYSGPDTEQSTPPLVKQRLQEAGVWSARQIAGRRWNIGCVSLEITQRCNLDCTLCYLSDHSEAVKDIPLSELFRRIDIVRSHYGPNTDVQISGGDPTLRAVDDLVAIVQHIRERGMRPTLFTNGILASRNLLTTLCEAGLVDVAFHVDLTQERKGYQTEADLNALRKDYIERARGLPLSVFFNTTVFAGNFHEIPALIQFFREHADVVRLVSFQLQADTGRGVLRERAEAITPDSVIGQINAGAQRVLCFDTFAAGHPQCNRYTMAFVINNTFYNFYDDPDFIVPLMHATAHVGFDRTRPWASVRAAVQGFLQTPSLWRQGLRWLTRTLWSARHDLWQARGRVRKLSFFVHNFMDACHLDRDRVHACTFMVASNDGPISMCLHNAKRDAFILKPIALTGAENGLVWDPLSGTARPQATVEEVPAHYFPLKYLRGRRKPPARARQGQSA